MTLTLADLTDAERTRIATAFHEAGHAVAAVLAGGRLDHARLLDAGDLAGRTAYSGVSAFDAPGVAYAGPWAEARWRAGRTPDLTAVYAAIETHTGDREALTAAGGGPLPRGIESTLERCWPAVAALAAELWAGPIRHGDVLAALGVQADPEVGLAMIRSGAVPGTFTLGARVS